MTVVQRNSLGPQLTLTSKIWRQALDARFRPLGLTQAQWLCLLELKRAERALSQSDLALRLGIEAATLVRLLDRMEQRGWIQRMLDNKDRRTKRIALTEQAHGIASRVQHVADRFREELLAGIPQEELQICSRILNLIYDRELGQLNP